MTNNGITLFEAFDCLARLFNPAGVFVSHDIRQFHIHFLPPNALDHMKVGTANAGAADSNEYICLLFYFWFRHLLPSDEVWICESSVIMMKYGGFHNRRRSRER